MRNEEKYPRQLSLIKGSFMNKVNSEVSKNKENLIERLNSEKEKITAIMKLSDEKFLQYNATIPKRIIEKTETKSEIKKEK